MMEHHLLKLLRAKSHESLEFILRCLWRSRKLGLDASEKDQIKDLLELSSAHELDPVIVCLRSLIRKSAHGNSKEELQRSFPLDFPPQLQELLLLLLLRLQSEWREDMARDQPEWSSRRASNQNSDAPAMLLPPPLKPCQLNSSWPRIEESRRRSNHSDLTIPMQISSGNLNPSRMLPQQLKGDGAADNSLVSLPRLKAMTWSMENLNSTPANRVAVINLKLQDYSKPSSGEIEIKFQLSRDTLEAMLRSMYYIRDQLSNAVTAPTGPALKKPRQ